MENKVIVYDDLIILERDAKYLLVNPVYPNPLFIPEGGQQLLSILEDLLDGRYQGGADVEKLLRILEQHAIVYSPENAPERWWKTDTFEYTPAFLINVNTPINSLSLDTTKKAIDYCSNAVSDHGTLRVCVPDAESPSDWDTMTDMMDFLAEKMQKENERIFYKYDITTTLSYMPSNLLEMCQFYGFSLRVKVKWPHERDEIVKRIELLVDSGMQVALQTVICSSNVGDLRQMAEQYVDLNNGSRLDLPCIFPFKDDGNLIDASLVPDAQAYALGIRDIYQSHLVKASDFQQAAGLEERLRGTVSPWSCGMPFGCTLWIDSEGNVFPCQWLRGNLAFCVGNVSDTEVFEEESVLDRLVAESNVDGRSKCKACKWKYLCGGTCPLGDILVDSTIPGSTDAVARHNEVQCLMKSYLLEAMLWELEEDYLIQTPSMSGSNKRKKFSFMSDGKFKIIEAQYSGNDQEIAGFGGTTDGDTWTQMER